MIYLVTGYMRSGTSCFAELCEAGGMRVARSKSRDAFNDANSDERYKPNHKGLYELSSAELGTADWPRRYDGHAVKVVATNLSVLRPHSYSAVVMLRDSEEIRQSCEGSFGIEVTTGRVEDWQRWAVDILARRSDVKAIKAVWYADLVADPVSVISSVGWPLDVEKAAAVVRPELYRFRSPALVGGI